MKVTLIDYTSNAARKMLFTKSTRLQMHPSLVEQINMMSGEEVYKEIEYISNTIPSSWEFVDYTFLIEGVTRAFTHQLVRNRHGSYAQQTMRILDQKGFEYVTGPTIDNVERQIIYYGAMKQIQEAYDTLIGMGVAIEDARGILPTNICTNIVAKYNLRTLAEMMSARSSSRTQGEYREVIDLMYEEVLKVHPWAHFFLNSKKKQAADKLDEFVQDFAVNGTDRKADLIKMIDLLRK